MTALYFQSFESTHRILHEPTFWKLYSRFWSNPEGSLAKLRLQVLLVIAIGSSLAPHVDADGGLRDMVHQWIYAAETWLSGPLEKDRLDISGLQIHCLVMLARQIFSIGGDLVWISSGSLIHRAMQIGLHRDPKHLPPMSVLQAQLRRRLWATILELVVQSSLDSALPPRISFDEFDTEPPANNNDNEIQESATELQPHSQGCLTGTSMQLILLDSLPTRLRILGLINSLDTELSYPDVLDLSADILDTCRGWNAFARENKESGVTSFHRNLLDYLLRRFLIPLHCPFANKARANPLFHYSLKVSLDAAMAIISPEPDEGFSNLMAIGGGLFREGIRYATSIISLELLSQVETQYLDGALHRNSHYINPLKKIIEDMISLSLERIRQGETNVKGYMFLCMIMAQAEATARGASSELSIAKSAKDSISMCLEILQKRLSVTSLSLSTPDFESTSIDERESYTYGLDFDMDFFLADVGFS
ncbi:c6 zinc finger domain-containing [Trichoderma arundinaceum]|uniref:C6 zinc finger domain-containing n=1 Tax=Trichoderma arundinaceum TaxID=490622 RepID=A0A395NIZ0_TRIAR|nr:c6 zinc finger domain-containing [Trichoderma arundinaceum]